MGLDGFSMGNLGLNTELTSAQMASNAEQIAQKEIHFKVKNVNESSENGDVRRREEKKENQDSSDRKKKEEKKNEEEELQQILAEKNLESKDPKEFSVRVNNDTEMVELFNTKDKKIMETISAKDLMGLLSKLDSSLGILVNRKI